MDAVSLKLIESENNNRHILTELFEKVKSKALKKDLYYALDLYDHMIFNDLDDLEEA